MSDGPSFKPDLLGSATVTILCRPIREVRVARPRGRPDRLGAHASGGGGFDETARRGVTCEDPAPVRSRPRWSRKIPTRTAHGIGHDHAWVFMDSIGNKAVSPKLAESAPNAAASVQLFYLHGFVELMRPPCTFSCTISARIGPDEFSRVWTSGR